MKGRGVASALRVALIYALIGVAWIIISDQVLAALNFSQEELIALQTIKGWGFVIVSAILIYALLYREIRQIQIAEDAQEESERTLSTMMANLPGVAYRRQLDAAWTIEFVSEGCAELTGYEMGDLINSKRVSYIDIVNPDDRSAAAESIQKAIDEERPFQLVYRLTTRQDEQKVVWEQGRGVYSDEGDLICLEGLITDVTERVEAEEEVRKRAAQQEALNAIIAASSRATDLSPLLIDVLKQCLLAFELNHGMIWVLDYVETEGISQDRGIAFIEGQQSMNVKIGGPYTVEDWQNVEEDQSLPVLKETVDELGLQASIYVPILAEGRNFGGVFLGTEQTRVWTEENVAFGEVVASQLGSAAERLDLLETIQEQAHLLQRILDTVLEGIFTLDVERRILVANPSAREYLIALAGVGPGEVLKTLGDLPFVSFLTPRLDGLPHEVETRGEDKRIFEVYPNPIRVGSEEAGWTILLRDVTEVRQAQRRVQEQIRRGAVGQLAAGIAHDFNNIVAAIILYSEMVIGMPGLPPKGRQRMTTILEQAHRAATLTRQILDFSRRGIMEPHPMDLVPFMKELVKLLERTLPENIRVRFTYGDDDYVVSTDPTRIQQVFMNLALNARDAMPTGGELLFELSFKELNEGEPAPIIDMPPGEWVQIDVSDTGGGIPEENLSQVFEPFFTTKPPGEGTGLSLAQVFGIIKQHDGFIEVSSNVGVGTTFTIFLKAQPVASLSGIITEDALSTEGQMETILVVEDDPSMRDALVEMLHLMNYQPLSACDGQDALGVFEKNPEIDLVLSDLVMPEMGGVALYEVLKKRYPDVKMVVMTGYPLAERGKDLLEQGIVAWLQKPLDSDTLAKTLRRVLSNMN
ncbi:MAG: response regulator [Anaerolineales bacterium]|nr:response regulator [Anaerolineales bacterium]